MLKLAAVIVTASSVLSTACVRERRDCREHEMWDGHGCHAERGYEHYWDHPDHRDWHPEGDHHDEHHDDHHDEHHEDHHD